MVIEIRKNHRRLFVILPLVAALLFLSGGLSGASGGPPASPDFIGPLFGSYWSFWAPAFVAAIMIGVGIVSLSMMYGFAAGDEKVKVWARRELVQLGYSVLILASALSIIGALSGYMVLFSGLTPSPGGPAASSWHSYVQLRCYAPAALPSLDRPCHIRMAEDYLVILAASTEALSQTALRYYTFLSSLSSVGVRWGAMPDPSSDIHLQPGAGLSMPIETLSFVFDLATKNLMAIRFQQYLLDFMHLWMFPLMLSMGLFFRAFYFTRRLGGLLIAIALAFYVVYPLVFVFFQGVLFSLTFTPGGAWSAAGGANALPDDIGGQLYPLELSLGRARETGAPNPASPDYRATCHDGLIQPGEECNEPPDANRAGGLPNPNPNFGICPPRDAGGAMLPGRENDLRCDFNSCRCTGSLHGLLSRDFQKDYLQDPSNANQRQAAFEDAAKYQALLCQGAPQTDAEKEEAIARQSVFVSDTQKGIWARLKEGYIDSWYRSILNGNDGLLGFNGVIDNLAKILLFSLMAPFIAIMVALAGVKALSPILGGDVEIAGLSRLI